jgi:hypothetical protein
VRSIGADGVQQQIPASDKYVPPAALRNLDDEGLSIKRAEHGQHLDQYTSNRPCDRTISRPGTDIHERR